jgi:hypothetical protein
MNFRNKTYFDIIGSLEFGEFGLTLLTEILKCSHDDIINLLKLQTVLDQFGKRSIDVLDHIYHNKRDISYDELEIAYIELIHQELSNAVIDKTGKDKYGNYIEDSLTGTPILDDIKNYELLNKKELVEATIKILEV